jgi:two-component system, OmpR family, KDP operon response regulator KdpE
MTARDTKVLVVDDEPAIRRLLRTTLQPQGYRVVEAETGREALLRLSAEEPDVMVLDLGLPDMDGIEVIRAVRQESRIPLLILSIRGDERGKVQALDLGADDYVTKPFSTEELLARIRAALRHGLQAQGTAPVFQCGDLKVDLVRHVVTLRGGELHLSPKEYEILAFLVANAGRVVTHQHLLRAVWGSPYAAEVQYLRVYVRQLRQKIEENAGQPRYLLTEPGVGYRLRDPVNDLGREPVKDPGSLQG